MRFDLLTIDDLGMLDRGRSRHRPRDDKSLYGGIYPFIQTGDVKHAPFYINNYSQTYNEYGLAQSKLWSPGTLCITIAANIADTAILNIKACFPDSILGFIPYRNKSDVRFVKYCFDVYKSTLEAISKGTTQDNLSLDKLRRVKLRIPSYPCQRKIAAVLSAYDDLVENNNRRIAILEKMAEELYREWFVRLRFPGHKKMKIVKGVPEGWEIVQAGKYFTLVKGRSYTSDEISDYPDTENHLPFINLKNFNRGGGYRSDGIKYYSGKYNDTQIVTGNSIVLAVTDMTQDRAVIGRVARIPEGDIVKGIISCDVVKINPINVSNYFLYALLRYSSYSESLKEFANGANVLHLKPELASTQKVIMPKEKLRNAFDEIHHPILNEIDACMLAQKNLTASRDRLLSRLMSGKIDVEKMDIHFPASMLEEVTASA
jgi:type I restriction enzyme, S subunit